MGLINKLVNYIDIEHPRTITARQISSTRKL
jgi:hypothetical protein